MIGEIRQQGERDTAMITTQDLGRGRMYWGQGPIPYGMILMGTVRNSRGETGALLRGVGGRFWMGNNGALKGVL